jgi:aminopeptidase N
MNDAANATQGKPREVRLADYKPPAWLVDTVDLTFDLDEAGTRVTAHLAVRRNPNARGSDPLRLDGEKLRLLDLHRNGEALGANQYILDDNSLTIPDTPDECSLTIETRIAPKDNTELSGLYVSNGGYFTQCEAEGFRRITYFPDRPDVMARYTVTIIAEKARYPVMLSNGNPGKLADAGGGRHRITWVDPHPKPSYLFALVAGDLVAVKDSFTTRAGRRVELGIWVRPGDEDRCAHAMRSLKTAMQWDEEVFGLEYDLDVFNIAAVSDFNAGAMENKGLNIFNTRYVLAKPATATDADYQGIEAVIAHEYFHNWTGNRVTCRDWFQLSLKEGLTVFRDQEFSADQGSRAVKRIGDVRTLRAVQFREDAGPLAHPVQPESYQAIDNFYTATVYNKGAEIIRMMRTLIGREAFRMGIDIYFARHDNQAVTIDEFVRAMQDASGIDLQRFKLWYHQAGTPEIMISDHYDAAARRYVLTVTQRTPPTPGRPDKQPLVIPLAIGLLGADGAELSMRLAEEASPLASTRVLTLTEPVQSFTFIDVPSAPTPSLFRGFSAPVRLSGIPPERLRFLAAHDTDPFVRWDSGQQHETAVLLDLVAAYRRGDTITVGSGLIGAMASTLRLGERDPAFAAEAMSLPSETFLADQMKVADVDAIHAVREQARSAIGAALHDQLRSTYERLTDAGPCRIDGASIGRRALRNTCLAYLGSDSKAPGLAKAQFDANHNMTDVLAALAVLVNIDCPERQEALTSFHAMWHNDALVLDKWFAIQATSKLPGTLRAVRALARHPDYDLRNPNRVRALVGSFAAGNPVRFHDPSGEGYRFVADTIITLDALNPQVAARMVSTLGQWRRMDPARQSLMKLELQRILDAAKLSTNTFEMASKTLV